MRVAVVVVPLLLMQITSAFRRDALERGGEVVGKARLEFDGRQCGGRADYEKVNQTGVDPSTSNELGDLRRQVEEIVFSASSEG